MKILLTSPEQSSLTGQPMYVKNLAKGLRELGHEVTCEVEPSGDYDLAIVNDYYPEVLDKFTAKKIYNYCHSKGDHDKPIIDGRITGYLAPREEVANHWEIKNILPIPIDFKRWQIPLIEHEEYRIIAPCTIDTLREAMIKDLYLKANEYCEVWIVGKDWGTVELPDDPYVKIFPETEKIEDLMCQCDEVAGIFTGTVTLEAWAMGLKTSVYDEYGNWSYMEKPKDFNKHDYIKVARQFLCLA